MPRFFPPGRPRGALNLVTREARALARSFVEDPDYRASLRVRVMAGLAPHMETLLWHYAYGKPTKDTNEVQAEAAAVLQNMSAADRAEWAETLARQARAVADAEAQRQLSDGAVLDAEVVK